MTLNKGNAMIWNKFIGMTPVEIGEYIGSDLVIMDDHVRWIGRYFNMFSLMARPHKDAICIDVELTNHGNLNLFFQNEKSRGTWLYCEATEVPKLHKFLREKKT